MSFDSGHVQILREALAGLPDITEKRMFGGICFLFRGNMLCGVHKDGAMFRVGKEREAEALCVKGARPMAFTGRKMGGMIEVDDDGLSDDARCRQWLELALRFVEEIPAK